MILGFPRAKQGLCHTKHEGAGGIILWALLTVFLVLKKRCTKFVYKGNNYECYPYVQAILNWYNLVCFCVWIFPPKLVKVTTSYNDAKYFLINNFSCIILQRGGLKDENFPWAWGGHQKILSNWFPTCLQSIFYWTWPKLRKIIHCWYCHLLVNFLSVNQRFHLVDSRRNDFQMGYLETLD